MHNTSRGIQWGKSNYYIINNLCCFLVLGYIALVTGQVQMVANRYIKKQEMSKQARIMTWMYVHVSLKKFP